MTALDAAIRARLDAIDETIADEFGVTPEHYKHWAIQPTIALRAVLVECDRCRRAGVPMAPVVVELLVARALGVDLPAEGGRS